MNTLVKEIVKRGTLGPYVDVRGLGEGGFGVVLRATHRFLRREVALKIPHDPAISCPGALQEAKVLGALRHPNILDVMDAQWIPASAIQDVFVLVTEFLAGGDLDAHVGEAWDEVQSLAVLSQIASALAAAHEQAILHRDLKPANILIAATGSQRGDMKVKLADFGLARQSAHGPSWPVGTPYYMAPEVWLGCPRMQSDVYAWGVLAFELITGKLPFTGHDLGEIKAAHFCHQRPSLAAFESRCSKRFRKLVGSALSSDHRQRPKDGRALLALISELRDVGLAKPRHQRTSNRTRTEVVLPGITCFYDDILKASADAVAYSANSHFAFGKGVSGSVLKMAGTALRDAVHELRDASVEQPVSPGTAYITPAFGLTKNGFRHVIHSVSLNWNPFRKAYERSEPQAFTNDISMAVEATCVAAANANVRRLALPLFGLRVGKRLFPELKSHELIAANLRGIANYRLRVLGGRRTSATALENIVLAVYDPSDTDRTAKLGQMVAGQLDLVRFRVGQLVDSNAETLVISANNWLFPGSGTARAVCQKAGREFQNALKNALPRDESLKRSEVRTFAGGSLVDGLGNRSHLIHVVTTWYDQRTSTGVRRRSPATPRDVYEATRSALKEAIQRKVRSVGLTLMCARPGYHTVPEEEAPKIMAIAMYRAINDMRVELATCVEWIDLVLPSVELHDEIASSLQLGTPASSRTAR